MVTLSYSLLASSLEEMKKRDRKLLYNDNFYLTHLYSPYFSMEARLKWGIDRNKQIAIRIPQN